MRRGLKQAAVGLIACWPAPGGGACRLRLNGREFRQFAFALADLTDVRESLSFLDRGIE
jgi:hypothetical protein